MATLPAAGSFTATSPVEVVPRGYAGDTVRRSDRRRHHHTPHWNSSYRDDPVTGGFASDLSALIEAHQPDLWVHGHVHHSSDYRIAGTRVIANPHGYGAENPDFDGELVVEITA